MNTPENTKLDKTPPTGNAPSGLDTASCSPEIRELVSHMCGLGTGTVCDSILDYLTLPDCSPRTRQRILEYLEANIASIADH